MLALGIAELPLIIFAYSGRDLLRGERPAAVLAAVHAFDGKARFVAGELEGMQAIDQEHVAASEGGSEGGHGNTVEK
jgi:hypothetical protein